MTKSDDTVRETGDPELEIAHVLFVDIVGYSKRLVNEQTALVKRLKRLVRETEQFRKAELAGKLITIPTGDGMALVFFTAPDAPVRCAIELSEADKEDPKIELRMGIHSGPVDRVADVNERTNVAGAGINTAQRVMDCGDAGHILLSQRIAEDLRHYGKWQPQLHSLGEIEVKHGQRIGVANLFAETYGNPNIPEKLKRARRAEHKQSARKTFMLAGVGLLLLGLLLGGAYFFLLHRAEQTLRAREAEIPAKSVAVLPFENLSADKENAFLAGGIQDEIITQLSKIGDLKVISRTSTLQYGSKPENIRQIAKELGVTTILEGTVQKVQNKIRVHVQLIRAAMDLPIWTPDPYDRELIDLLKVQIEIARQVATTLSATLTAAEKERLDEKVTNSPEAYALYLKGTEVLRRPAIAVAWMEEGQRYFEGAISLDPQFALAHARLAQIHTRIAVLYDPSPMHRERGRTEAEEALRLQSNLSEGHLALGLYHGRLTRDYGTALKEYELAKKGAPNDVYIPYGVAWVEMKQGRFREAIAGWEKATTLDPMNWNMFNNLADAYSAVGRVGDAEKAKRRSADLLPPLSPERFGQEQGWAWLYFYLTGSFEKLDDLITRYASVEDPNAWIANVHFDVRMAQRKYADAEKAISESPASIIELFAGPRVTKNFYFGIAALVQGDAAKARPLLESELQFARNELREAPDNESRHAQLGIILAYLGQKEEAIAEGKRAVELMPSSRDALDGPLFIINLAEIYGRVGEADKAMDLLEQVVRTPAGLNVADLKFWHWDPLRNNPRFLKLANSPPPKIEYH